MLVAVIASVGEAQAWRIRLEEALYRQSAFVSEVLKTVGALITVLDRGGRIVSFNRACEEASGYTLAEVKGKCVWDLLLGAEEVEPARAFFAQLRAGQFPNAHENYWVAKDGARRLIYWTDSCLTDSSGAVEYVIGTGIEVTERRQVEEALRASEARFRALVQNSSDTIVLLDGEGTVLYQSPSIERLLGYRPEERIGQNVFRNPIVHPDDQAAKRAFVEAARHRHEIPLTAEFRLRHADGSWRRIEAVGQSFLDDPGVAGIVANYRDVTDRKTAEEALRQQAQLLHLSHDAILVWRKDGGIEQWNRGAEQLYGFTKSEALGRVTHELLKTIHPVPMPEIEAAMREHGQWEGELRHFAKDGHEVTVSARHQLVLGTDGIERILETNRDVTDRKRAEEALRESEEKFRLLADTSPAAIIIYQEDKYIYVNAATEGITGYTRAELLAQAPGDIVQPDYRERVKQVISRRERGEGPPARYELQVDTKDGQRRWMDCGTVSIRYGNKPAGLVVAFDITERKRAEDALWESAERLRLALDASHAGTWEWDLGTDRNVWSEEVWRLYGLQPHDCEASYDAWRAVIHPDDRARAERTVLEAARDGVEINFEYRVLEAGGHIRWLMSRGRPLLDSGGKPVRYVGIVVDITERKHREEALHQLNVTLESKVARRTRELEHRAGQLQRLTQELTEAEERERKRLAGVLHDDLQQLLAAAKFHVEVLSKRVENDAESHQTMRETVDLLVEAIAKSRSLSHELSLPALSRGDLDAAFEWLAGQMQEKHGFTVHLEIAGRIDVASEPLRFFLYKAAQELLLNAIKHAGVREATVRLRRQRGHIRLTVGDRGRGFDPADPRRALGFGLVSIRERVEGLGGRMKIKSAPGKGSVITIAVPETKA